MCRIINLILFLSLTVTVACSSGSGDDTGIPCIADNVCQRECKRDPDCATQASQPSATSTNPAVGAGGQSIAFTSEDGGSSLACPKGDVEVKNASGLRRLAGCQKVSGDLVVDDTSIADFGGLETVTAIDGSLIVRDNSELKSFNGLPALAELGGDLTITNNKQLGSIDALAALTKISGSLQIRANAALANVNGLVNVTSVTGDVYIRANTSLANLAGLDALRTVGGSAQIGQNQSLSTCEVKNFFTHTQSAEPRRICENAQDKCGSGTCPDVW